MASIISASIDLTKIDKAKIYEGKKGKYYPITVVLNDEPGQYGDSGYIMTEQTKEERDAKVQKQYLGNVKVVWTNGQNVSTAEKQGVQQSIEMQSAPAPAEPDLPF
jgi:hypothetical protein|tara:strand:- start:33 stop:350 length:318 start_codon:yes stop_codon:yes gene_type:complete